MYGLNIDLDDELDRWIDNNYDSDWLSDVIWLCVIYR